MEAGPTALERLQQQTGRRFPALVGARARTAQRLRDRAALLDGLPIEDDVAVVLMGSWGRHELTGGSDDDYLVLVRGVRGTRLTPADVAARFAHDPEGFSPPGASDVFGGVVDAVELLHVGLDQDTNRNMTRRVLLVLESVAACHADVLAAVRRDIVANYLSDALKDRRPPRFLLNDLVRYWRTIAVDFVAKGRERPGEKWGLRNAKLRTSRKLLFASGLLPVLRCHELRAEQIAGFLAGQFALPPTDRVADAFLRYDAPAAGAETLAAYDAFLQLVDDADVRAELSGLEGRAAADASPRFREVAELGATIERGLLALLFETELGPIAQRYAIF